jgi:hypothetical protein
MGSRGAIRAGTGHLVGLVPETGASTGASKMGSLFRTRDEGERGRRIEVALYLDAGIGADDRPAGWALRRERARQDGLRAARQPSYDDPELGSGSTNDSGEERRDGIDDSSGARPEGR